MNQLHGAWDGSVIELQNVSRFFGETHVRVLQYRGGGQSLEDEFLSVTIGQVQ